MEAKGGQSFVPVKVLPKTSSLGFFNAEGLVVFSMESFEMSTGKGLAPAVLYNLEACQASAGALCLASNVAEGMAERHRVAR